MRDKKSISFRYPDDMIPVMSKLSALLTDEKTACLKQALHVISDDIAGDINKEFNVKFTGDGKKLYVRVNKK